MCRESDHGIELYDCPADLGANPPTGHRGERAFACRIKPFDGADQPDRPVPGEVLEAEASAAIPMPHEIKQLPMRLYQSITRSQNLLGVQSVSISQSAVGQKRIMLLVLRIWVAYEHEPPRLVLRDQRRPRSTARLSAP